MLEFSILTISVFTSVLVSTTRYIAKSLGKDISKVLPILAIVYGVGLAIAGYYTDGVEIGNNIIEAIFIGIATGASATGFHQVGKQLNKEEITLPIPEVPIESLEEFTSSLLTSREATEIDISIPVESNGEVSEESEN